MEFILEFIAEIFFEGIGEAADSPRVPKAVRVLITTILFGIVCAILVIVALLPDIPKVLNYVFAVLTGILIFIYLKKIIKIWREEDKK